RAASPTRTSVPTSTPGGNHPNSARLGCCASCKSSTPAPPSPSPRRRPPDRPAPPEQPPFPPVPEPPPFPAPRPSHRTTSAIPDPRPRSGQGSLPRAHRGPSFRVSYELHTVPPPGSAAGVVAGQDTRTTLDDPEHKHARRPSVRPAVHGWPGPSTT